MIKEQQKFEHKFGRKPRTFDPRVKQLCKLMALTGVLPKAPPTVDWTKGIKSWGMMLNDRLGDCTCAAVYHARQVWTANTGVENTQPDAQVLKLYEQACGYDPNNPNSDQGGIEQEVLKYLYTKGIPLADGSVDKILGFVEANPKIVNEVKVTIHQFGLSYIGFNVPDSIYDKYGRLLPVWNYVPGAQILGGHAVILVGYDLSGFTFISWGKVYKMSWNFFSHYCEEAYAIADKNWLLKTGKTPLGLTVDQLKVIMSDIAD